VKVPIPILKVEDRCRECFKGKVTHCLTLWLAVELVKWVK
jgi:hypothetical protein